MYIFQTSDLVHFEPRLTAYNKRIYEFAIVNHEYVDVRDFLHDAYNYFENEIGITLEYHHTLKVGSVFSATFEKIIKSGQSNDKNESELTDVDDDGDENGPLDERKEKQTLYIQTQTTIVDRDTDLWDLFNETIVDVVLQRIDEAILQGSGFTLSSINELVVQVNRHEPLRGSAYLELHPHLKSKLAIVNVKNYDEMCFKWAILSALHPVSKNPQRVSNYIQYEDELNFTGIEFPVKIRDIGKFEKLNPSISVNVYIFNEKVKKIQPVRLTKAIKENHIHLLHITENFSNTDEVDDYYDDDNEEFPETETHYCWIKNFSRLVSSQISNHNGKLFICDRCLNHFHNSHKLQVHQTECFRQNACEIEMPTEPNDKVKFKNIKNQSPAPFVIYADVEALLKEPTEEFGKSGATVAIQEHEVYSIGYYLSCSFDQTKSYYKAKRGVDCIDWFVNELYKIGHDFADILKNIVPIKMMSEDELNFKNAKICHICEKEFEPGQIIAKDHSHFDGSYRGAAHQHCNLQYQENRTIPVVFHNLGNYDAHFLLKKLATGFKGEIKIIPINSEKYISFIKTVADSSDKHEETVKFKFIDSFRFMPSSLDYLSSLIPSEKKSILRNEFKNFSDEQLHLLERKGVFCYDYVDSWSKLEETALPHKDAFYSSLTNEHISEKEYEFAVNVWEKFNIKTLGEYADLYLKVDVCLLAIVFENFRQTCSQIYKLDAANYYTIPGLSYDAMLKYTNIEIELLKDVDMLLFVERGNIEKQ